jgi:hypothetical protein
MQDFFRIELENFLDFLVRFFDPLERKNRRLRNRLSVYKSHGQLPTFRSRRYRNLPQLLVGSNIGASGCPGRKSGIIRRARLSM